MPALTSYSPYETLVFFQNVAQHGADTSSLQTISTTLNQNQLIRESDDYDAAKFSPDALQHLYNKTVNAQPHESASAINGELAPSNGNPLKRKLSASPPPKLRYDGEQFIQQFVDKLYARFKDETIRELRRQEDEHRKLQGEIKHLEDQVKTEQTNNSEQAKPVSDGVGEQHRATAARIDRVDPVSAQLQASLEAANEDAKPSQPGAPQFHPPHPQPVPPLSDRVQHSPVPTQGTPIPRSASGTPHQRHAQLPPPNHPVQHQSPGALNRTLPPPSPQRANYASIPPPPHAYPHTQQGQPHPPMLPPAHHLQRMPSHEGYSTQQRAPSQGRGSPMPQLPHPPYPQYSQYQPPPPQGWHSPGPQQYPQQQYPPPQHYPPHPQNRHPQVHTPNQPPYQSYPQSAPVPHLNQQQWRGPPMQPYHQYPASAATTPLARSHSRTAAVRSGSSTPWKNRSTPRPFRARSPSRLDREVSPLSDHDSPIIESPRRKPGRRPKQENSVAQKNVPRDKSATPAANVGRSQSILSNVSEAPDPPKRRVGRPSKVKPEPPSTPVPTTPDSEQQQRSSGRKGRPRAGTATSKTEAPKATTTTKRKRDAPSASPAPAPRAHSTSNVQPPPIPRQTGNHLDSSLVIASKTFGRTSQLVLNEITSHKLAGIFAKPLSERDAPGYKSLVHRPQDLKSIKAAISKGSRAAVAAIEELESKDEDEHDDNDATPTPTSKPSAAPANANASGEGPVGNGFYLIRATEDLVPPKGIVNSSQLEMELVRMFANAVMFNPLPTSERGFGRSLRLRKRGGEVRPHGARSGRGEDDADKADSTERSESEPTISGTPASESESSSAGSSTDEGGIIADAREMFADVEKLVARWRGLEGESMGGTNTLQVASAVGNHGERHASVSASSVAAEEIEGEGTGTPSAGMAGSMRKRRRVGDH